LRIRGEEARLDARASHLAEWSWLPGVSVGLQAVGAMPGRVGQLNGFLENYRSGEEYDNAAITHITGCSSHFPGLMFRRAI
jgi:hypothetical protein